MKLGKMVFIFLQKLSPFSKKSNFSILDVLIHDVIKTWNKKYILLSNLRSEHSLLMKFGQFMAYCKRKNFVKKFHQNWDLKTSSWPSSVSKERRTTFIAKWNFWSKLLILDMYLKNYQNLSKSIHWPPQIPFYRGYLDN